MKTEPIYEKKIAPMLTLTIYENRLEFKAGFKKEMILFRNITTVDNLPMQGAISIKTSDGKKHKINVNLSQKQEVLDLIMSML
jgi:hypothetical protein